MKAIKIVKYFYAFYVLMWTFFIGGLKKIERKDYVTVHGADNVRVHAIVVIFDDFG
jgi:hypothetical protein